MGHFSLRTLGQLSLRANTLIGYRECELLEVVELGAQATARGLRWMQQPIVDQEAPSKEWNEHWSKIAWNFHRILRGGGRVLFHCAGGLDRSSTVAALILIEAGMTVEEAMAEVRKCQPLSIQGSVQESYLRSAAVKWQTLEHRNFLDRIRRLLEPFVGVIGLQDRQVIQVRFRRIRQNAIEYEVSLWDEKMQCFAADIRDDVDGEMMSTILREAPMEPWMQGEVTFGAAIGAQEVIDMRLI